LGLRAWITDPFGLRAMAGELASQRKADRDLIRQVVEIAQAQTQAAVTLVGVIDRWQEALKTDGTPPEGRLWSEELEAELYEQQMTKDRG
jgi:hypothetical protein